MCGVSNVIVSVIECGFVGRIDLRRVLGVGFFEEERCSHNEGAGT